MTLCWAALKPAFDTDDKMIYFPLIFFLIVVPFGINAGDFHFPNGIFSIRKVESISKLFASLLTLSMSVSEKVWFRIMVVSFQVIS